MYQRILGIVFIGLLASGCASKLVSLSQRADASQVQAKWAEQSFGHWDRITPISIDDKFVGSIYEGGSVQVDPGPHTFVVLMKFNRGPGSGPFEAKVTFRATLWASGMYRFNGSVNGGDVKVWLEESKSGERSGDVGTASWQISPRDGGVMPIIIPVKR